MYIYIYTYLDYVCAQLARANQYDNIYIYIYYSIEWPLALHRYATSLFVTCDVIVIDVNGFRNILFLLLQGFSPGE